MHLKVPLPTGEQRRPSQILADLGICWQRLVTRPDCVLFLGCEVPAGQELPSGVSELSLSMTELAGFPELTDQDVLELREGER